MHEILQKLTGGDFRSIGRSEEVVADVIRDPSLFAIVFNGMLSDDPLIRMRSADAIEKITARHPQYLQPFAEQLITQVASIKQQEVRWHVAQMFPRLQANPQERAAIVDILLDYLNDKSQIVKTFSLQALADLAQKDATLRTRVLILLEDAIKTGSPAVRSRARKLLHKLSGSTHL